jgi:hypothetical protein
VTRPWIITVLVVMLVLSALCFYALWSFWPTTTTTAPASERVSFFGAHLTVRSEVLLFAVVALAGALGGLIHTLRSLSWYVGNRQLVWSWLPFYALLPLVGAALATIFYLVFRGGLFSGTTTTAEVNTYGFAALAALAGLFSEQAMEKLRTVFAALFTEAKQGIDHVEPDQGAPVVTTGEATGMTAAAATFAGIVDPRGGEATAAFEYGQTTDYGERTEEQPVRAEGSVTAEVGGLSPGTTYHFRLVATSAAGQSAGRDRSFTTPPA